MICASCGHVSFGSNCQLCGVTPPPGSQKKEKEKKRKKKRKKKPKKQQMYYNYSLGNKAKNQHAQMLTVFPGLPNKRSGFFYFI